MRRRTSGFVQLAAAGLLLAVTPLQNVQQATVESGGRTRRYALLVPDNPDGRRPLLVLLHGSGRDGRSIVDPWAGIARREGIILAGPDSLNRQTWGMIEDGPHFLYDLVADARTRLTRLSGSS